MYARSNLKLLKPDQLEVPKATKVGDSSKARCDVKPLRRRISPPTVHSFTLGLRFHDVKEAEADDVAGLEG